MRWNILLEPSTAKNGCTKHLQERLTAIISDSILNEAMVAMAGQLYLKVIGVAT